MEDKEFLAETALYFANASITAASEAVIHHFQSNFGCDRLTATRVTAELIAAIKKHPWTPEQFHAAIRVAEQKFMGDR